MVATSDGHFAVTGRTDRSKFKKAGDVWLVKVSDGGQLIEKKYFGDDKTWEEALAITETRDQGLAIAGFTRAGNGDGDMWLIKTDASCEKMWSKTYGGKDEDWANAITETQDGNLVLAGKTKSYHSSARQFRMSVVVADGEGEQLLEKDFGGKGHDEALAICELFSGNLIVGGVTNSQKLGNDDAWITSLRLDSDRDGAKAPDGNVSLELSPISFHDLNGNALLEPEERGYFQLQVQNSNAFPVQGVKASSRQQERTRGMEVMQTVYIGTLQPGERRKINVPVYAKDNLVTGGSEVDIDIESDVMLLGSVNTSLNSKTPVPPILKVSDFSFTPRRLRADRPIKLTLSIANDGELAARSVNITFKAPPGVQTLGGSGKQTLDELAPGSMKFVDYQFVIPSSFSKNELEIEMDIKEPLFDLKISDSFRLSVSGGDVASRGGSSGETAAPAGSGMTIIWMDPNPDEWGSKILTTNTGELDLRVKAVARKQLKKNNFKTFLNGDSDIGSKFEEADLRTTKEANRYTMTYKQKIALRAGRNTIYVKVQNEDGEEQTLPLTIDYNPTKPNLHVLAIGASHEDLKYTRKDASDFAQHYRNLIGKENRVFNEIFVTELLDKALTTNDKIKEAFLDLSYRANDEGAPQQIRPQDVLIVFISSHGTTSRGRFKILPSNYNPRYRDLYSVDFQQDILQQLNYIDCKKFVFLDACHSGSAFAYQGSRAPTDTTMSKVLNRLITSQPGLDIITSCGDNQLSYEDEQWENGAFTEAILEAFQNEEVLIDGQSYRADADQDAIITVRELYNYLRKRVPNLVETTKSNPPTAQVPYNKTMELDKKLPVYILLNN